MCRWSTGWVTRLTMAHFIYGFLHELNGLAGLSSDDADEYGKWLARLSRETSCANLDIWQPLMVVPRHGAARVFTCLDETDAAFVGLLKPVVASPSGPWSAALHVATVIVAAEMHLHGAAGALGEPNDGNKRLLCTPQDTLVRDILHDIPARIAAHYQACVGEPCRGHAGAEQGDLWFRRTHDVSMYECFVRSFVPPFTCNAMGWYQFYRCLDLRQIAFRQECSQGDETSLYGEVVISFAHVNE